MVGAKVVTLKDGVEIDAMSIALMSEDLAKMLTSQVLIRQYVREIEGECGINSQTVGPAPAASTTQQYRWVLMEKTSSRVALASNCWYFLESHAMREGDEAKSRCNQASEMELQIWRRTVPIPTVGFVQQEAATYMLGLGLQMAMQAECSACQADDEHDDGSDYTCHREGRDIRVVRDHLQQLEVSEEAIGILVEKAKKAFNGSYAPGSGPLPYPTIVGEAQERLMTDRLVDPQYGFLFDRVDDLNDVGTTQNLLDF